MVSATLPASKVVALPKSPRPRSQDLTPQQIISKARQAPAGVGGTLQVSLISAVLLWLSFTPCSLAPMAWVSIAPLCLLVRLQRPTKWMYLAIYCGGFLFWLPTLQWMRLGDPTMYVAWIALSVYLAAYFPLFVGLSRLATHRMSIPMIISVPATWVGLEYLRAHLLTGFAWYQLGHSQANWLELIQISDFVGAYGVSFIVAMCSAAVAMILPGNILKRLKLLPVTLPHEVPETPRDVNFRWVIVGTFLGAFLFCLSYGYLRRYQASMEVGPRVAALQGNFVASVHDHGQTASDYFLKYRKLTSDAIKLQADVIVWPEVMFPYDYLVKPPHLTESELKKVAPEVPEGRWRDTQVSQVLTTISQAGSAALVIGAPVVSADTKGLQRFNSAVYVTPATGIVGRYDKQHLVPFGEYLPFSESLPFLGAFSPYRGTFGLHAGNQGTAFEYKGHRFSSIICFEDTVPHLVRKSLRDCQKNDPKGRKVDVLLNLTNDGWFHGSSEHDQHLNTAIFRAVEFRTPLVRAVNTGVSAIIDGDGAVRAKAFDPKTGRSKWCEAVVCGFVPLDNRSSMYLSWGDWFAQCCLLLCLISAGTNLVRIHRVPPVLNPGPTE